MSQSPPPGRPRLAHTGTSPASGSPGPGPVSCTWMRIRPDPAPDPRGHRGAAVLPGVTDGLTNPDHEILQGRVGDLAAADAGDRVPDLGG